MHLETLKWKRPCVTSRNLERRINTGSKGSICSSHFSTSGFEKRRFQTERHAALWLIDLFSRLQTTLSPSCNATSPSLLSRYFHGKCLDERSIFRATSPDLYSYDKPCYVHRVESSTFPPYSIFKKEFLDSFFPRIDTLCNRFTRGYFPEHCKFNFLSPASLFILLIFISYFRAPLSVTPHLKWLLTVFFFF